MRPILLVPGHRGSGPAHWVSLWEAQLRDAQRVEMPNWEFPRRAEWVEALDEAIQKVSAQGTAPILVGHGLGCLAIVHWACDFDRPVQGALLVAPMDVEAPSAPDLFNTFAPVPRFALPFPCRVVASASDPHLTRERARDFAEAWAAEFQEIGDAGALDAAAHLGDWPRGEALLQDLM